MKITLNDLPLELALELAQPVTLAVLLTEHHHPAPGTRPGGQPNHHPAPAVGGLPGTGW